MTDTDQTEDISFPWVEKYRPKRVEDVIGAEHLIEKMNEYIKNKSIPHLLFVSGPGQGKTTVAKILADEICGKDQYLYINASDRNNIETIRNDVVSYCGTVGFGNGLKIIILDESDGLTPQAQKSLRNVMEEYAKSTRFILTANYGNKLIEAIHSRCQAYEFYGANKTQVMARLNSILKSENIKYGTPPEGVTLKDFAKSQLTQLVDQYYPDIRLTINTLQKFSKGGLFKYDPSLTKDSFKNQFIELLKKKDVRTIRETLLTGVVDYPSLYKAIFYGIKELTTDKEKTMTIMILASDGLLNHSTHLDSEMNFVATLLQICRVL
jgi:replication factor C small subunit